jgi:hypothetical protein
MCGACINKNRIGRTSVNLATIAFYHLDIGEVVEIIASAGGELGINLYRADMPFSPDDFSHDCCVVAGTTTYVHYMIAPLYFQPVDQRSQKAGMTIVKLTTWIDRHKDIVVEAFRICVLRCPVAIEPGALNLPGAWPKKMLAWHRGEGSNDRFGLKIGHRAEFFSVPVAR